MERNPPKYVLELKKTIIIQQQNITRLYGIVSALYQEIQDLKHHTSFKAPDSVSEVEKPPASLNRNNLQQIPHNNLQNAMNVLDNVEQFADSRQGGGSALAGRRMKIINN